DAEKTNRHYTADNYKDCAATAEFNIYETLKFNYQDEEYDLVIESAAELKTVLQYTKSLNPTIGANGCTVDVFVKSSDKTAMKLWKERLDISVLYDSMLEPSEDVNGNEYYTFYLK
ncbi:MAG: hypothetical protein IJQ23_03675, partial [Clostridia bacterium]|nr:hypothetical protein [Clostridia bacterium]